MLHIITLAKVDSIIFPAQSFPFSARTQEPCNFEQIAQSPLVAHSNIIFYITFYMKYKKKVTDGETTLLSHKTLLV